MTVVCLGELLIDFVSDENGVTVEEALRFEKKPGGAPANVAVGVARLGHACTFMGQVGDDPFGHYLAGVLAAEGINTDGLTFSTQARTMLAFVSLKADGERSFSFYRHPSADMLMTAEGLPLHLLDAAKIFHFGSITLISEPSRSATLAAAQAAVDKGLIVSYDPNLRLALWESDAAARQGMLDGFAYADIVKISDEELVFLGGDLDALWHPRTQVILVTHGADGATAYTRAGNVSVGGFAVRAIDTTGAGDAFVAGILSGVLQNPQTYTDLETLRGMLRFANANGALTTTQRGAIPALPTRDALLDYLKGL